MAAAATATAKAEPMTETTGLAIITSADQFNRTIATIQKAYHVLTPFTNIGAIAPQHAIFTSVVQVDTDKAAGEVYDGMQGDRNVLQFLKAGEVALAKNGLRKIAEGLGISIHLEYLSDGGAIRHFYHVKAVAAYRGLDGSWVQREASELWDLRDGSERMRGWTANQVAEGRKHGLRQCETRAINAAIRECGCGVKQSYKKEELSKPFLAFRVNFVPDMADPEQRRAITERAMQGASVLFAQQTSSSSVPSMPTSDAFADAPIDAVPVGSGATAAAQGKPTTPPTPKADEPPNPDAVKVKNAFVKEGVNQKTNKPWKKSVVVDHNDVEYSSFDMRHVEDAKKFQAENAWVDIGYEMNGPYRNIIEITKAQPSLPGLDEV